MNFRLIRQFPKIVLVAVVLIGSTVLFGIWWFTRSPKVVEAHKIIEQSNQEDIAKKVALIESKINRLLLIDNDLYDLDTGELIFKNWLKDGMPIKLFWDASSMTVVAQYQKGFVRYAPDGTEQARLLVKYGFASDNSYKWVLFAQDKDIWKADVDWKDFKFVNQRKITNIEQFNDVNFAGNVVMGTGKTLVVQSMAALLRVNLDTGETHPVRFTPGEFKKRQAPNGEYLLGTVSGQFYCYDLDTDRTVTIPIGRNGFNDYLWLNSDRCVMIADGRAIVVYDRSKNALTEICALPMPCIRIGESSPGGRYLFATGRDKGVLVDLEGKTATPIAGGQGICWLNNDTFAFSREVPDSTFRGTWLQTAGSAERRISEEPFLVGQGGGTVISVMNLKSANLAIFVTKHGLMKMNPDGSDVEEAIQLARLPSNLLTIGEWKH